jgi:hypothetical protein
MINVVLRAIVPSGARAVTNGALHYHRSHICANDQTHDLLHAAKLIRQS